MSRSRDPPKNTEREQFRTARIFSTKISCIIFNNRNVLRVGLQCVTALYFKDTTLVHYYQLSAQSAYCKNGQIPAGQVISTDDRNLETTAMAANSCLV